MTPGESSACTSVQFALIRITSRFSVLAHSLVANPVVRIACKTDRASGLESSQITRCNRLCQLIRTLTDHAVQPIVPAYCNPNGHAVFKEGLLVLPAVPMGWSPLG